MLFFVFIGFLIGFLMSLRFVKRPLKTLIWGLVLGGIPFIWLLGPGSAPVQGIGSALNFAFFALGRIMLIPIIASSAALGMTGASIVLLARQDRPNWIGWATGSLILGLVASVTLLPVIQVELTKHQLADYRKTRVEEIIRADFKGTMAGNRLTFPASPRLYLFDTCAPDVNAGSFGCSTNLNNPVSIFTKQDEVLLHERNDPIIFRIISVRAVEQECRLGKDYCLTQKKIDRWCNEIRPDQADSIWCRDTPPISFSLRTDTTPGPSDRDEPELASGFAKTPLGPGRVTCFYAPNQADTERQGANCKLTLDLVDGVKVILSARRTQLKSQDPSLSATIALIPEYWAILKAKH